jgi:hypothetical protein
MPMPVRLTLVLAIPLSSLTTQGEFTATLFGKLPLTLSRHYIENTSTTEDLIWIEIYKSDHVADIPLGQWLALTPADIVAQILNVPISFVEQIKKDKQILIK